MFASQCNGLKLPRVVQFLPGILACCWAGCESTSILPGLGESTVPVATFAAGAESNAGSRQADNSERDGNSHIVRKVQPKLPAPVLEPLTPPKVILSAAHARLCQLKVGDKLPPMSLPRLNGPPTELTPLCGKQATVVLFWQPDRWMAEMALVDLEREIAQKFAAEQVAVVGVVVQQSSRSAQAALNKAKSRFVQLLDLRGKFFATVGKRILPRVYVLDSQQKIAWFDLEYTQGTRRDLAQTLAALTSKQP
ncbi:MAG: redoxin family protein [Pirellulales bacterium]|nr:redoxin family protein [Pirellulales bacterium]